MVRLVGERIVLREWRPDETDAMHRWLGNPEVTRYLDWGSHVRSDSARHLRECVEAQQQVPRTRYFLAIELRTNPQVVVGDAGFEWRSEAGAPPEGGLGYFLEPEHWGHGYATEAASLLLDFAFRSFDAALMRASCDARNRSSEGVMQKCGMRLEPDAMTRGRRAYHISREDWRAG
jgi:RimJ/RimL family protein N-acetyltransferase